MSSALAETLDAGPEPTDPDDLSADAYEALRVAFMERHGCHCDRDVHETCGRKWLGTPECVDLRARLRAAERARDAVILDWLDRGAEVSRLKGELITARRRARALRGAERLRDRVRQLKAELAEARR